MRGSVLLIALCGALLASATFAQSARAEDADCSNLYKSDSLRKECSLVRPKLRSRSDIENFVKMGCRILKTGYEGRKRREGTRIELQDADARTERALQDCIDQYPGLWDTLPPPPTPAAATPTSYTRGLDALNEGDLDTAIAEFTAAIADDPKNPFSYIRRGI